MSIITYRKDIDGLRAVAVLLVIFAHAKIAWLSGGFVGVDVFFVISGYLITSIIKRELDQGTFSFVNFYMRRVRRILPALVFLIAGTVALSIAFLFPSDLMLFAKSVFAGITAWSNIFFSKISGGYWGRDISAMPLAHLWSLAVEEQFYFIWPTVLFALYLFVPSKKFRLTLIGLLLFLFWVSAFQAESPKGYYKLTARAFELMLGAVVALEREKIISIAHRVPAKIVSGTGLALILLSALFSNEGIKFPGVNALWPCLGAALLVIPPRESSWSVGWLESRLMVYIGKISYSLYLWHWPFFAFILYNGWSLEEWRWEAILLSFLVAMFSYHFVEQPFRKSVASSKELIKKLFIIPVGCSILFFGVGYISDGMAFRYSAESLAALKAVETPTRSLFKDCHLDEDVDTSGLPQLENNMCFFGEEAEGSSSFNDGVDIILVGDSHADAIRGFVEVLSEDANLTGVVITKSSTPYLPNVDFINNKGEVRNTRREQNDALTDYVVNSGAKYVVLTGRYSTYLYGNNESTAGSALSLSNISGKILADNDYERMRLFAEHLEEAISRLVEAKKIPVVIKDVPEMGIDLSRQAALDVITGSSLAVVPAEVVLQRQKFVDSVIDEIAIKYPSVRVINPKELICRDGNCFATLDDMPLYVDDDHLNYYGSRYLGEKYLSENANPFSAN